jgi:hypothetical protein
MHNGEWHVLGRLFDVTRYCLAYILAFWRIASYAYPRRINGKTNSKGKESMKWLTEKLGQKGVAVLAAVTGAVAEVVGEPIGSLLAVVAQILSASL